MKKKKACVFNSIFCVTDAIADDTVRYTYVKKKGYVRLHTNKGDLNLELHCDKVIKYIHSSKTMSLTKKMGEIYAKFVYTIMKKCLQNLSASPSLKNKTKRNLFSLHCY